MEIYQLLLQAQAVNWQSTSARTNFVVRALTLCLLLAGCKPEQGVDDYPETIYPDTPTMKSAVDAMETK